MITLSEKLSRLLMVLNNDYIDMNICYQDSLKDPYKELGFEKEKSNSDNQVTRIILDAIPDLIKQKANKLYCRIFNFTQTYYAIKENLIALSKKDSNLKDAINGFFSKEEIIVKDFFSDEQIETISRIAISNALKHDAKKDLIYKSIVAKKVKSTLKSNEYIIYDLENRWFYNNIDVVDHYNKQYSDLIKFLKKHNLF